MHLITLSQDPPHILFLGPVSMHQSKTGSHQPRHSLYSLHPNPQAVLWFPTQPLPAVLLILLLHCVFTGPALQRKCGHSLQSFTIFIFNLPGQVVYS